MNSNSIKITLTLLILLISLQIHAQTRYVTDEFEITLRSGASTSNSIIAMLKSGEKLKVLEQNEETKYSLVETEDGKTGYVITRFLDKQASGRARVARLQVINDQLKERIASLEQELGEYKDLNKSNNKEINTLKSSLAETEKNLNELTVATRDTIQVLNQNESLKTQITQLESDKEHLATENRQYKDRTAMDWFIRGAAVSLIAFLLGIIVTRVRWKKRDSWGNY